MSTETANNMRQLMALYYAFGRQDGAYGNGSGDSNVDPINFAEWYLSQWEEFQNGSSSYMPSVQDAWDRYRRSLVTA